MISCQKIKTLEPLVFFFFYLPQKIIQDLYYHETLMIISHKNTIKVLMQIIENLNIEDVEKLDINNSNLIIYNFDKQLNLLNKNILN